ncbi:MAG: CRISPR-associated endoribonuclease Cas6 [Thermoplasmatales archaeon]
MPRLLITLTADRHVDEINFDKHMFQSAIYSKLQQSNIGDLHEGNRFRFFTFSDFFPSGPLERRGQKSVIVSSPSAEFIGNLLGSMESVREIYLGNSRLSVFDLKPVNFRYSPRAFTTGSPIVLYKDNRTNLYFSLRRGDSLAFFLMRLKDNALKRYRQYTGDAGFDLPHPIFDTATFNREVAVKVRKMGREFIIIGSAWYKLERFLMSRREEPFYRFVMDAGLGEKPSLGFGMLNPIKGDISAQ